MPLFDRIGEALKGPGWWTWTWGQAVAQATLMAFEQGLGTCCQGSADWSKVEKAFGLPESCRIVVAQTVGYPLENPERREASARACPSKSSSSSTPAIVPFPAPRTWWTS